MLHVAGGYWPQLGGGERLTTRASEGLAARGHRVHVLLVEAPGSAAAWRPPGFPPAQSGGGVEIERPRGWGRWARWEQRLHRWPVPGRGELRQAMRALTRRSLARTVARALDRLRPDAVLLTCNHVLHMSVLAGLHARRPFPLLCVPQLHDDHPYWPFAATQALLDRASAVGANTPHEAERLRARYGVAREAVVVTGCGSDPPTAPGPWPRAPRVLYLGRIDASKGIDTLLAAMRDVWAARPHARLVVAGARCPSTPPVEGWIAALPAAERARVDVPRDLGEDAKAALLASAGCLVLPSRHESFGIVVAEAWAHGTPVVALDTPVLRATVADGQDGLLVPVDDRPALAQAIGRLLDDEALARRLGAAGRAAVLERHTWAHVAERFEQALLLAAARHAAAVAPGAP